MKFTLTYIISVLFTISLVINSTGQQNENLFINPGFENPPKQKKYQPIGILDMNAEVDMTPTKGIKAGYVLSEGWVIPTLGTSDYFNDGNCTAFGWPIMEARSGEGRGGLILDGTKKKYREYLQGQLKVPLKPNRKYCLKFYIAHEKVSNYAANEIHAYFSNEPMTSETKKAIEVKPHVTLVTKKPITHHEGWVEVCGTYIARGGERYVTIGNFNKESSAIHVKEIYEDYGKNGGKQGWMHPMKKTAYYYVDDASLTLVSDDSLTCEGWRLKDPSKKYNWVFLIDASGSMSSVDKLPAIKRELQQLASSVPPGNLISLVTFSDGSKVIFDGVEIQNTHFITTKINSIIANGGSGIGNGMKNSLDLAQKYHSDDVITEVFVFTDAAINGGQQAKNDISKIRANIPGIKVHTVHFGGGRKHSKLLKSIAEVGGGDYYSAKDLNLGKIFEDHIGLEFFTEPGCNDSKDCCEKQQFMEGYNQNNTTYLLDVSGSMNQKTKLPLLQKTLINLSDSMRQKDYISIVQFSSSADLLLEQTSYRSKEEISKAIDALKSKGATELYPGMKEAIENSKNGYIKGANNNIVLATDGGLKIKRNTRKLMRKAKKEGITFSVLHFSNKDGRKLKRFAKKGGGIYHHVTDATIWEEMNKEIKRKKMGPDFYYYDNTYSQYDNEQVKAYRWSRVVYVATPFAYAFYAWLNSKYGN